MSANPFIAESVTHSIAHRGGGQFGFVWFPPLLMGLFLIYLSDHNPLLFHTLAELFAIGVALLAAVVVWHTYPFSGNHLLMFLGCGYLWVGMLDLIHTLTFKGMGIYPFDAANPATQFWIAARYFEALLLLFAPSFLHRPFSRRGGFLAFAALSLGLYWLILNGHFPDAYLTHSGLTPFKVYSEYLIIALLLAALARMWSHRREIGESQLWLLSGAIALTIAAEFTFTTYSTLSDRALTVGHLAKLASFWLLFVAVVRLTLTEPFRAISHHATSYDAVPDPTLVVDGHGRVRSLNRAARRLIARPPEECLDHHVHTLFHPSALPLHDCPVCRAVDLGRPLTTAPLYFPRQQRWYDVTLSPIETPDGVAGMVHVMRDITEATAAKRALESSEARYREIMAHAGDAVLLIDPEGCIVDVNLKAERLLDHPRETLIGLHVPQLHPEEERPAVRAAFAALAGGDTYLGQHLVRRRDGELLPVEIHATPLHFDGQDYVIGILRDLRERLAVEERERRVDTQLSRAERLGAAGEIATTLAHELNQPLAAVVNFAGGCVNRLRRGECDPEALLPALERIIHQGRLAGASIHRLRAFLRGDAPDLQPLAPSSLVEAAAELLDGKLRRGAVRLISRLDHLPALLGDRLQLQQVMINLIINAIDAMEGLPAMERLVEIDGRVLDHGEIELRVRDHGPGVAEEALARIFEPFHSTKEESLGMGLAVCRTIVEAHHGRIEAHNQRGLTIRLVLPQAETATPSPP